MRGTTGSSIVVDLIPTSNDATSQLHLTDTLLTSVTLTGVDGPSGGLLHLVIQPTRIDITPATTAATGTLRPVTAISLTGSTTGPLGSPAGDLTTANKIVASLVSHPDGTTTTRYTLGAPTVTSVETATLPGAAAAIETWEAGHVPAETIDTTIQFGAVSGPLHLTLGRAIVTSELEAFPRDADATRHFTFASIQPDLP